MSEGSLLAEVFRLAGEKRCLEARDKLNSLNPRNLVLDLAHYQITECFVAEENWQEASVAIESSYTLSSRKFFHYSKIKTLKLYVAAKLATQGLIQGDETPEQAQATKKRIADSLATLSVPNTTEDINRQLAVFLYVDTDVPSTKIDWQLPLRRELLLKLVARSRQADRAAFLRNLDPEDLWDDPKFLRRYAQSYARAQNYAKAFDLYKKDYEATRHFPTLDRMTRLLKLQKRKELQEKYLLERIRRSPNRRDKQVSYIYLGRFYWNNNKNKQAKRAFQRSYDLNRKGPVCHLCCVLSRERA